MRSSSSPGGHPAVRWLEPWTQLSRGLRLACVLSWLAGSAVIVCDLALGWDKHLWSDRPFLTNIASGLTAALFGLPFGLVVIAYLARLQEERLQSGQHALDARRGGIQLRGCALQLLVPDVQMSAYESLRGPIQESIHELVRVLDNAIESLAAFETFGQPQFQRGEGHDEGSDEARAAGLGAVRAAALAYNSWPSPLAADIGASMAGWFARQWTVLSPVMYERAEDLDKSSSLALLAVNLETGVAALSEPWPEPADFADLVQSLAIWAAASPEQGVPISSRLWKLPEEFVPALRRLLKRQRDIAWEVGAVLSLVDDLQNLLA